MPSDQRTSERLLSLDAFRGFVIAAMIWVNYLAGMPGIPYWLEHTGPAADGITLPDIVFPAFLFIVGVAIPLSLQRAVGKVDAALAGRLLWRAASLMVAGVVLANAYRYDAQAALLPRAWYFLLFYVAMILLWRQSSARDWSFYAGAALMLFLLATFRGTLNEEFDSIYLQHTWWGILGMIGWTYLLCSVIFLAPGGRPLALVAALIALVSVYFVMPADLLPFVNVPQVLGSTAANVMAGAVVGTLFARRGMPHAARIRWMLAFAVALLAAGLLLRPWGGINKIQATASYSLVCAAIALALFLLFYVTIDVFRVRGWAVVLLPAGANALFAYIAPDLCEQLAAVLHLPRVWWPFLASGGTPGLMNAVAMTAAMVAFTALATRAGLRLKF